MHTDFISPAFVAGIAFKTVKLANHRRAGSQACRTAMAMVRAADGQHSVNQR